MSKRYVEVLIQKTSAEFTFVLLLCINTLHLHKGKVLTYTCTLPHF